MSIDRRALAGALATFLLVSACSSAATQAPGATRASGVTQAPGASQEPGSTQASPDTQAPGAAGDLAAKLPSVVNGVTFVKTSFNGGMFTGDIPIGGGDQDFAKFLADNGKSMSDVVIAMATATGSSAGGSVVMAFQVKGVPSDKLLAWATKDTSKMPKTSIGGKEVYGAAEMGFGASIYVKDDVIFYVLSMGGDASMAEGVLKQLP